MTAVRKKKLYFDVALTGATFAQAFPCTQFRASYAGDNFGGVFDDLPPLNSATASGETQRRNSVSVWFAPTDGGTIPISATIGASDKVYTRFVFPTTAANFAGFSTTQIAGLTFGSRVRGSTPIGTRHFAVSVSRGGNSGNLSATVRGVLYVQRQHSIEI